MKMFIQQFGKEITAVLSGFDRMAVRGSLRRISYPIGMMDFLFKSDVSLKDFGRYVNSVSKDLIEASCEMAVRQKRPVEYLASTKMNKEDCARKIMEKDGIREGLITIIKCVELCKTFHMRYNREKGKLELVPRLRKCSFLYHYMVHPDFGFMNARIQSWFPFPIQICLNGREWLSRTLTKEGIRYDRYENCFPWIEDFQLAQRLLNRQLKTNWPGKFNRIARMLNPIHNKIFKKYPLQYYWSVFQSEWATDIVFKNPNLLQRIYPRLLLYGMVHSCSPDAMRFLGKKVRLNFDKEVISKYKLGPEGVRIKHQVAKNSVKLYGKYFNLLRAETTINNPNEMKSYRPSEKDPHGQPSWRRLRNGVADLNRRAEISQAINNRYLDSFACIDSSTAIEELFKQITQPTTLNGYSIRGLRPSCPQDLSLFKVVMHGEFVITGFRNADIQKLLFQAPCISTLEKKRRSAKVSRLLRILKAHHIIRRIPSSYRYLVTQKGAILLKAILSIQRITLDQLNKMVA